MEIKDEDIKQAAENMKMLITRFDEKLERYFDYHDEAIGHLHHMILDIYKQQGLNPPDLKMKNKHPKFGD